MPFVSALASILLQYPDVIRRMFGGAGGALQRLFGGRGAGGAAPGGGPGFLNPPGTLTPAAFGGGQTVGRTIGGEPGFYGHRGGAAPTFEVPGAGGGSVGISELARGAAGGDPFALGATGRQAESAQRISMIDALINALNEPGALFNRPEATLPRRRPLRGLTEF